ncbi:enoyl-CoA hydratase/isomerase family protein [Maribius pontilimi]|uniref:Enoyl-CoA hydratase/isomerase family protein n=1 Tax=Palleronia pontilimi TaxID=1964209 RepID=A0A934IGZ7_9RHOB|nr:enoyl-CoA hydratase/isomerase family protein [Palleronia pontilimi]MBJ3763225.1 enoyl-CoA hydratase/isomerase family protein [Palleronia pontilimi]
MTGDPGHGVLTERHDGCLRIVLNRPDKANALTADMLADLRDAVRGHDGPGLVLTGAGKVFCAGADLDAARAGLAVSPLWEELSAAVAGFGGLSIAALNGSCAGGAIGMVLACDLRVAVPGAKLFYPVMKLGFLPQPSDPGRLVALVGPARAKLLLMGGAKLTAEDALAMGLVDRIDADPVAAADELLADAMAADPDHVRAIKAMLA